MLTKLNNPTVAEVIELLKSLPPDAKFQILDADTAWTINIIHVEVDKDGVWFSGDYAEMEQGVPVNN